MFTRGFRVAGEGFEPSKAKADGFTVRSHWPLGQPAVRHTRETTLAASSGFEQIRAEYSAVSTHVEARNGDS